MCLRALTLVSVAWEEKQKFVFFFGPHVIGVQPLQDLGSLVFGVPESTPIQGKSFRHTFVGLPRCKENPRRVAYSCFAYCLECLSLGVMV